MPNMTLITLVPGPNAIIRDTEPKREAVRVVQGGPNERLWRDKGYVTAEELAKASKRSGKSAAQESKPVDQPADQSVETQGAALDLDAMTKNELVDFAFAHFQISLDYTQRKEDLLNEVIALVKQHPEKFGIEQ
jgi:hypothetical protein